MQRLSLPICDILVEDRQRQDLGDISSLAESLAKYGLLQPIVVNQKQQLIAGGRRLTAATSLGWTHIDVVYRETFTKDELHELELIENVDRLDMNWQEKCLCIARIHHLKKQRAALDSKSWGLREAGELFKMDYSKVGYVIKVADYLKDRNHIFWQAQFTSAYDAWQYMLREEENRIQAELAQRGAQAATGLAASQIEAVRLQARQILQSLEKPDLLEDERARYYANPLNPKGSFEAYWENRVKEAKQVDQTVYLSNRLFHTDCLKFMDENPGRFDHILSDIPYGIDMDNLNQQNPHGGMIDIDTVEAEHTVEGNLDLMAQFYPLAYSTLKPNGFCILWCDFWNARYMADLALKAGFKVQRWPITWVKLNACMNQSAQYNFTKSTEIALVARKGNATLTKPCSTCVIEATNAEARKRFKHPFAKPFECWDFLIQHCTLEEQLVLEPFAGSGSGVIPLIQTKRNYVACELNQTHYNELLEQVKREYLKLNSNFIFK